MLNPPAVVLPAPPTRLAAFGQRVLVCVIAFLTLVDLFATQSILPTLTMAYGVTPAAMGFAVNASTIGMAIAGAAVAMFSHRIDRRTGIVASLALLSVPTSLLALAPDLLAFTVLRIAQGLCMASAFTLTLAYLGEHLTARQSAGAFAAYITGNVASNLIGRLAAAGAVDHFGLAANFYIFAGLNLAGAALAFAALAKTPPVAAARAGHAPRWIAHLRSPALRAAFAIGFCILFAFIGTFTYVNFVLVREPFALGQMSLGYVYVVFLPSIFTTPAAGLAVAKWGVRRASRFGLAVALAGLPLLLLPALAAVLAGLVLVGVGTFLAQAIATGFVGRAATADRGAASGLYLACYFAGGMSGAALLGQVYQWAGWPACVAGIGAALIVAAALAARMTVFSQGDGASEGT